MDRYNNVSTKRVKRTRMYRSLTHCSHVGVKKVYLFTHVYQFYLTHRSTQKRRRRGMWYNNNCKNGSAVKHLNKKTWLGGFVLKCYQHFCLFCSRVIYYVDLCEIYTEINYMNNSQNRRRRKHVGDLLFYIIFMYAEFQWRRLVKKHVWTYNWMYFMVKCCHTSSQSSCWYNIKLLEKHLLIWLCKDILSLYMSSLAFVSEMFCFWTCLY